MDTLHLLFLKLILILLQPYRKEIIILTSPPNTGNINIFLVLEIAIKLG